MAKLYHLSLKAQKVQSFIFKVPKLKAMLGANSLLGEFFAVILPELRAGIQKIPKEWDEYITRLSITEPEKNSIIIENDNIIENFKKGVICSAGSHFETFFEDINDAESFIKEALLKGKKLIPGVKLSYYLREYENFVTSWKYDEFEDKNNYNSIQLDLITSERLVDNPYFYPSAVDGENPQALVENVQKGNSVDENDSYVTKAIKEQGDKFYKSKTQDYLCKFLQEFTGKDDYSYVLAGELKELAELSLIPSNNKIAVVAIDGNAMGLSFQKKRVENGKKSVFEAMTAFEEFWFEKRTAFRVALSNTLIKKDFMKYKKYPYHILMLGGDDLLLVTVPELAFDIVGAFCENLDKGVTISAGIAFVKQSFPFSQAQELAESLLSSAKIKSRIWEKEGGISYRNAIDWHVLFSTGSDEISEIRRQHYMLEYKNKIEILTQRPCTVTEAQEIWQKAKKLYDSFNRSDDGVEDSSGRNKYKQLRTLLKTGEANAVLYGNILDIDQEYLKYNDLVSYLSSSITKIKCNPALDVIELMDFHKRKPDNKELEGNNNESN